MSQTRRFFIASSLSALASPALATDDVNESATTEIEREVSATVRHNISSFRSLDWKPYFKNLDKGAVLVDISSRALHFWSEDESLYKLYPSSVPLSEELTRRGRTKVTRKVVGPSWRPTPSMLERNPEWPKFMPPGPDNPLGSHALYLSWQYYRIHGTHDTRKNRTSIIKWLHWAYNEHVAELFELTRVGTQVLLI